jgi:hypothetical protein
MSRRVISGLLAAALCQAVPSLAQDTGAPPPAPEPTAEAEPVPAPPAPVPAAAPTPTPAPAYELPDPATLTMPKLAFTPSPTDEADFDKYFYFHRADVTFAEAYADIRECDALASGSSIYLGGSDAAIAGAMANYGVLAGGIGGALGGLLADAIWGSGARRQQRRVNLRNCMGFKGYQRYGLTGDLWKDFNFEEGHGRKKEGERDNALELQALVASGPKPTTKELGL